MAALRITIPDGELPRVVLGLSTELGYESTLPDGTLNPQARIDFCRAAVLHFVVQHLKNYEWRQAAQAEQRKTDASIEGLGLTVT
jgi:hypothetical protein